MNDRARSGLRVAILVSCAWGLGGGTACTEANPADDAGMESATGAADGGLVLPDGVLGSDGALVPADGQVVMPDGGRVDGLRVDATLRPDGPRPDGPRPDAARRDAARRDAPRPPSCGAIFSGAVPDYHLCESTAGSCLLYTRNEDPESCDTTCGLAGRACLGGWDDYDEHAGNKCILDDVPSSCLDEHVDQICLCARN